MNLDLHPDLRLCQLAIGAERAPLLVIDNFVANADALVADAVCATVHACAAGTTQASGPRRRSRTGNCSRHAVGGAALAACSRHGSDATAARSQHVSTSRWLRRRRQDLAPLGERIPHVDSLGGDPGWRASTTCSTANLGGTAFYRHRSTGFEVHRRGRASARTSPALERGDSRARGPAAGIHQRRHRPVRADRRAGRRFQPHARLPAQLAAFGMHRGQLRPQTRIPRPVACPSTVSSTGRRRNLQRALLSSRACTRHSSRPWPPSRSLSSRCNSN